MARRGDGSAVAWGFNGYGKCTLPALPGMTFSQIAADEATSTAIVRSGGFDPAGLVMSDAVTLVVGPQRAQRYDFVNTA